MLRTPSEVWSTIVCSVGCYGDRGHDGDIAGGVELSAKVGLGPRGRERPGEKGETIRGLTAELQMVSGLGDALETTNSTATMVGARRGERRRGGDAGLPGSCGAVGRKRELWRSF